ncbi:uncharacterized protein LOC120355138 [Nilaparvata lugens]|uniref:uncharacterized protein LOC120355138 n=1 Tax=Nilaparvata lugens TaxID=108931 RepID=UPI00193EB140|nr:uncharacterized protein LOC120355138 [Nilaparvata lugens]
MRRESTVRVTYDTVTSSDGPSPHGPSLSSLAALCSLMLSPMFNFSEFGVIVFLSVALKLLVDLPFQNLGRVLQSRKAANTKENLVEKCDSSEAVFSKNTGNATNDNEAAINRDSDLRRRQGSIRDIGTNL